MKGIFEKGSPRSSKIRIPTILMMLKSKDPQGRNHPKHRAQLLQLQPGSCPSRRPRQSWQQVGKIIFNQRLCQIIERLTRISSPGEWDFYDESLSSPRSRLSLKPDWLHKWTTRCKNMALWLGCIVWGANLFIREILFHHKSLVSLGVNVTIAGTGELNKSVS